MLNTIVKVHSWHSESNYRGIALGNSQNLLSKPSILDCWSGDTGAILVDEGVELAGPGLIPELRETNRRHP